MPAHSHPDRTPSLRLYLDDGVWFCFACSRHGGDVVQWVQETEGVPWRQAIEILDSGRPLINAWAGVTDYRSPSGNSVVAIERPNLGRTPAVRVQETLDAAWDYLTAGPLHARAVAYLANRGIDVTTLESYTGQPEVGHTPTYGPSLTRRLLGDGFSADELVDAGLSHRYPDGRTADFYRQRVLLPVRTPEGRLAATVGRNVGDPRWPKYKNSPRTVLYDKSVNLYQPLPRPKDDAGRVIVVEGTIDALAIASAAVHLGVATDVCPLTQSGRELSARQVDAVLRMHSGLVVAGFDGDAAGQDSNRRLARAVSERGREVVVVNLPADMDPADWLVRKGPAGLAAWFVNEGGSRPPAPDSGRIRQEGAVTAWTGSRVAHHPPTVMEVAF